MWVEIMKKKRIHSFFPSLPCFFFAFLLFSHCRLRRGACSVRPPIWVLWAWLHHRVLPDAPSHQLRGAANAEDRERVPRCHPAGHAPQPTAGGLLLRQARGGVPRQYVRRASEQRWGVTKKWNPAGGEGHAQVTSACILIFLHVNIYLLLACQSHWKSSCQIDVRAKKARK